MPETSALMLMSPDAVASASFSSRMRFTVRKSTFQRSIRRTLVLADQGRTTAVLATATVASCRTFWRWTRPSCFLCSFICFCCALNSAWSTLASLSSPSISTVYLFSAMASSCSSLVSSSIIFFMLALCCFMSQAALSKMRKR